MYSHADEWKKYMPGTFDNCMIDIHVCKQFKVKMLGFLASSCVVKNAYKNECGSL